MRNAPAFKSAICFVTGILLDAHFPCHIAWYFTGIVFLLLCLCFLKLSNRSELKHRGIPEGINSRESSQKRGNEQPRRKQSIPKGIKRSRKWRKCSSEFDIQQPCAFCLKQAPLILALILSGAMSHSVRVRLLPPDHISLFPDSDRCLIQGRVFQDPVVLKDRIEFMFETEALVFPDSLSSCRGRVLVKSYDPLLERIQHGDRLRMIGRLTTPSGLRNPGGFDYQAYLHSRRIYRLFLLQKQSRPQRLPRRTDRLSITRLSSPMRRWMLSRIDSLYPAESASLIKTLLTGDKSSLDEETRSAFSKTGIVHILAVSGLHVGFILLILTTVFGFFRLPSMIQVLLVIAGLILFAALAEGRPSVCRAALMASLYLTASLFGRRTNALNILGFAALVLLIYQPESLFDTGFLLSFSAVLSILILYNPIHGFIRSFLLRALSHIHPIGAGLLSLLAVSLAAQVGTAPLTISTFTRLPLLSGFINLFAVPLAGFIVLLSITSLVFSVFAPWAASAYAALNHFLIVFLKTSTGSLGTLNWISIDLPPFDLLSTFIYYLIVVLFLIRNRPRLRTLLIIFFLILMNVKIWLPVFRNDYKTMCYTQLDVGQGDAAVLRLPKGRTILIDGGDRNDRFDTGERLISPFLIHSGIRRIDTMILTHPHGDHLGGLIFLLERFKVRSVFCPDTVYDSRTFKTFLNLIHQKEIELNVITAPDSLIFESGIKLYFLNPLPPFRGQAANKSHAVNNRSIVTQLYYGDISFLLTGDAEIPVEKSIVSRFDSLRADVLKLGHHGSETSTSLPFLKAVSPHVAILSVGSRNRHGHPADTVLRRIRQLPLSLFRTDQHGAIQIFTQGKFIRTKSIIPKSR